MKSVLCLALAPLLLALTSAHAADKDQAFFDDVAGYWSGPGEIVAGKYKGTRFTCSFAGSAPPKKTGVTLDGACRIGIFTQKMTATVERKGRSGYRGIFQDGAKGKGLDIVSGNVVGSRKMVLGIDRNQLKGAMLAKLADENSMTITVSVRVAESLVPVIGMNLKRVDTLPVGAIEP